jgi:hypothetical protein
MCTEREVVVCKLGCGVIQQGSRVLGVERWCYWAARESETINP